MSWMMAMFGLGNRSFCVDDSQISIRGDLLCIGSDMWMVTGANVLVQGCLVQITTTSLGTETFEVRFSNTEDSAAFAKDLEAAAGREGEVWARARAARLAAPTTSATR